MSVDNTPCGGKIKSGEKIIDLPTIFLTLKKNTESEGFVQVTNHFETLPDEIYDRCELNLERIGGIIIEANDLYNFSINRDISQQTLDGKKLTDVAIHEIKKNRLFLIDPNLDRISKYPYRNDFLISIPDYLTNSLKNKIKEGFGKKPENNKNYGDWLKERMVEIRQTDNLLEEGLDEKDIEKEFENEKSIVPKIITMQNDYNADWPISPYNSISLPYLSKDLERFKKLYNFSNILCQRLFKKTPIPIISIKNNVLKVKVKRKGEYPRQWLQIYSTVKNLDSNAPFIGLKVSDFTTTSLDSNYKGILDFFKGLSKNTHNNIIMFGMNEFAYGMMVHGLKGYTHPIRGDALQRIYSSGSDEGGEEKTISNEPNYYVIRKMENYPFSELNDLHCNCPYCFPYSNTKPKDIDLKDKITIKFKHRIWAYNIQLQWIVKDLEKNNDIRNVVSSLFSDSDKKGFFNNII